MILLNDQIIGFIKKPKNEALIQRACEILKTHQLHVKGIGLQEFLSKIEGYENDTQAKLRQTLAKATTVPLFGKEMDLMSKVFSAQGTSKYYQLSEANEKDFREYLNNDVGDGLSITEWMRDIWLDKVNYNCTGVVMGELPAEQTSKPEPYVIFKGIEDIHDIYFRGNKIEYIIFKKTVVSEGGTVTTYRVIDDKFDYIVTLKDGAYRIDTEKTIPNPWGYVPCKFISNQRDYISSARTSYIWKAIGSADEYVLDSSIHTITKKLHGFPRYWERQRGCKKCKGQGFISHIDPSDNITPIQISCNSCSGTGLNDKADVSDKVVVPMLSENGQPDNLPVMGYVQIDNATPQSQLGFLKETAKRIHMGIWASNQDEIGYSKADGTATGAMLDIQSVWDKLCLISENAQEIELFITNLIGQIRYGADYKGAVINYGKRYFVRSADEVEQLYLTAKKAGLPSHLLDAYVEELIYIRFGNDPVELEKQLKLNSLEPFIHLSVEQVKAMEVSKEDFYLKLYFTDYIERFEREVKPIAIATEDEIEAKIEQYNDEKLEESIDVKGGAEVSVE